MLLSLVDSVSDAATTSSVASTAFVYAEGTDSTVGGAVLSRTDGGSAIAAAISPLTESAELMSPPKKSSDLRLRLVNLISSVSLFGGLH